jgi:hypothetical protein
MPQGKKMKDPFFLTFSTVILPKLRVFGWFKIDKKRENTKKNLRFRRI